MQFTWSHNTVMQMHRLHNSFNEETPFFGRIIKLGPNAAYDYATVNLFLRTMIYDMANRSLRTRFHTSLANDNSSQKIGRRKAKDESIMINIQRMEHSSTKQYNRQQMEVPLAAEDAEE